MNILELTEKVTKAAKRRIQKLEHKRVKMHKQKLHEVERRRIITQGHMLAKQDGRSFLISVIVPVYNSAEYLADTMESLLKQTVGFENIQVVLVDDGSKDESWAICQLIANQFPNNVIALHQENKGVSAARNLGLIHQNGLIIGFLDSDDKISKNCHLEVLKFALENEQIDVFAMRTRFFEGRTGNHQLNYICEETRVINLEQEYYMYPLSAARSYFRQRAIQNHRFQEGLKYTEDSFFVHQIMLNNACFGALSKPIYYYRKRLLANSASNYATDDTEWYTPTLIKSHLAIMELSNKNRGELPKYIQYAIAYDLCWRLRAPLPQENGTVSIDEYQSRIESILSELSDEILLSVHDADICIRLYALSLKNRVPIELLSSSINSTQEGLCVVTHKSRNAEKVFVHNCPKWNTVAIDCISASSQDNSLTVEGRLPFIRLNPDSVKIQFLLDEQEVDANVFEYPLRGLRVRFDETLLFRWVAYKVSLPLAKSAEIKAQICIGDGSYCDAVFSFGKFAHLNGRFPNTSYTLIESRILLELTGTRNLIKLSTGTIQDNYLEELEKHHQQALLNDRDAEKWVKYRKLAVEYKAKHANERLWLFSDRITSAEDSGEVMFRHIIEHPIKNVRPVFIIREDVPDYQRLKIIGEVVAAGSDLHLVMLLCADKVISSVGDEWVIYPFSSGRSYLKDMIHFDYVFLQHGVIKDSLASWLNKKNKNISLFVTSAQRERESIINGDYGYDKDQVILTGLPRWDSFEKHTGDSKRIIYIMPTWREYLVTPYRWNGDTEDEAREPMPEFFESDYYHFYSSLLTDSRLKALLEDFDYILKFALHPSMGSSVGVFPGSDRVEILKPESFTYSEAFKEMSLLVTDYSSVAFNIAIMKKPILYAQFDKDTFYEKHIGRKDYFEYEQDGFGPIAKSVEQTIDYIETYLKSGMVMPEKYKCRVDDFFFFPPANTSRAQLVFDEILNSDKKRGRH